MHIKLFSSALDHSLPEFLVSVELQASADAPFRLPSRGRGLGPRRVFNALTKPIAALAQAELPELPSRWSKEASILQEQAIDLEDPAVCDRSTWRMAVVERIEMRLDDRFMNIYLRDQSSHRCALDKGADGKANGLGSQLDDLLESIYDDYLGLRHTYLASELAELVADIDMQLLEQDGDPDAAFHGDPDYEDADILNMRAELLVICRMTRRKMLEIYRRFILPWLHQILPQTFLLWALKSAHEKAQARFEGLSRHLANIFLGQIRPLDSDGAHDIYLWARAIHHVTSTGPMPPEEDEGAPLLVLGKRSRQDSEVSLTPREEAFTWDHLEDDDDKVSTSSAEDDEEASFWTEMTSAVANEVLLSYCEVEPDLTDPLWHPPCLVPPDDKERIEDVFADHDSNTRKTVKQAHARLMEQFAIVSGLQDAIKQARAEEELREEAMAPAPEDSKTQWKQVDLRISQLSGRMLRVRKRFTEQPDGGGVKEASSLTARSLLPSKPKPPLTNSHDAARLSKADAAPPNKRFRRSKSEPIRTSNDIMLHPRPPLEDRYNSRALVRQAPLISSSSPLPYLHSALSRASP